MVGCAHGHRSGPVAEREGSAVAATSLRSGLRPPADPDALASGSVEGVSAEAMVDAEVRAQVRDAGIDPAADPDAVRTVIADAVAAHARRRLSARLPVLTDPDGVARRLFDAVAGLGPLQPYLDDPDVEEIWINSVPEVADLR